jgi:predicted permease
MRRFFLRARLDRERASEMQAHLDHLVDDLVARGLSRETALREARRRFGNPTAIREEIYAMNSVPVMDPLVRDVRYALRMLRKTPGFTIVALMTLAIGIGVNTAIFTVVNALLLEPLPYPQADRLATISTLIRSSHGQEDDETVDGNTFLAIHDGAVTVDSALMAGAFGSGVNLVGRGVAANVKTRRVSAGYFAVLGVRPFIGREFTIDEDRAGGPPAAMLSYELWSTTFGADRNIVGSAIMLRGEPHTVIGVMPKRFSMGVPVDVWTPAQPSRTGEGGGDNYLMVVRVRDGFSWQQADAEIGRIGSPAALDMFRGRHDVTTHCHLVPMQQTATEEIRLPLLILWGAVGLVLLIACVNMAGLLLARSATRVREIATRLALGSSRVAVMRQMLVESVVLALGGGILGIGVGAAVLLALARLNSDVYTIGYPVRLDGRVLAATLVLALGTSLLFGLVPALLATRVDVRGMLVENGARGVSGSIGRWPRRLLVAGEIAITVVLLVGGGLLVRTFVHLHGLNPGFDPTNVTIATVSLQDNRYEDPVKVNRLFADTLAGIRRQPGVEAAGVTLGLPYTRLLNLGWGRVEGATVDDRGGMANVSYVTPGYFEALRLPIEKGRPFTDADVETSQPVVIVNDEFVRRYYNGRNVVGLHIRLAERPGDAPRTIVGVVANARGTSSGLAGADGPLVTPYVAYVPSTQVSASLFRLVHTWFAPSWVVRSSGSPSGVGTIVGESIVRVDPMLPIARLDSMAAVEADALKSQRLMMWLVVGLGAIAVLLAAIGIHGLVSTTVTERTRELGIRLALGASGSRVVGEVVARGLGLAIAGVVVGSGAAVAGSRLVRSFLWGVTASDPVTYSSAVLLMLTVAFCASVLPAWRILRLDPATTLRSE